MVGVLLVGSLIWNKKFKPREWIAGLVIVLGCGTYLFALPPKASVNKVMQQLQDLSEDDSFEAGVIGGILLLASLFFDALVSTAQERVFGKNPTSSDPFGPESPVLDQMIWTNLFAAGIAVLTALLTGVQGSLAPNVQLLFTTPALVFDVCLLSLTSAVGLILLLNTISSFGALTSSLIMTTRQFLSIIINAGLFGNFGSVSVQGWCGVGWVASGIYIKMNKSYNPPKTLSTANSRTRDKDGDALDKDESDEMLLPKETSSNYLDARLVPIPNRIRQYFYQYLMPLAVPIVLISIVAPILFLGSSTLLSSEMLDSDTLTSVNTQTSAVAIQGGKWAKELHQAIEPTCAHNSTTEAYRSTKSTGFVSYPRSGNSYMRSLIERTTGFQTSSIYCDRSLSSTFKGECDYAANFFVKTHFPALSWAVDEKLLYYEQYDQVMHFIRNPLDTVASYWHLSNSPNLANGELDHEGKVKGVKFGSAHRTQMRHFAEKWVEHATYWKEAPIQTHTLRYEDLKAMPVPSMMGLLPFLLPEADLPSLVDIACMVETDHTHEAYTSQRISDFASWNSWEPELRSEILAITRGEFCAFGYHIMLTNKLGKVSEMEGFCDRVEFRG